GVGGRGAGGRDGGVGTGQAEVDGNVAGRRVGDHFRDHERADLVRAVLEVAAVLFLKLVQAADAAADDRAAAEGVFPAEIQAAVLDGVDGRHQRELREAVQPPG